MRLLRESLPEALGGLIAAAVLAVVGALLRRRSITRSRRGDRLLLADSEEPQLAESSEGRQGFASQRHRPPVISPVQTVPANFSMDALDNDTPERFFQNVQACPLDREGFSLLFDLTNPNEFDMRIVELYVDVIEFVDVEILSVITGDLGGGMIVRRYVCEIEPLPGRYKCTPAWDDFDYIKLSPGEMEAFRIDVKPPPIQGIYRLRVAMKYSVLGNIETVELGEDVLEIGLFDQTQHRVYNVSCGEWESVSTK